MRIWTSYVVCDDRFCRVFRSFHADYLELAFYKAAVGEYQTALPVYVSKLLQLQYVTHLFLGFDFGFGSMEV